MPLFEPNSGVTAPLTLASGTITASAPALDISQTWNNGAVTFTGLKVNATDTASASTSTLFDFQQNGVSRFSGRANGNFYCSVLVFGSDVVIAREAANTLALRNGANAQTLNLYGTFTDASNYRRLRSTMSTGGAVTIAAEGLGTGLSGNTLAFSQNGSAVLTFSSGAGTAIFAGDVSTGMSNRVYFAGRGSIAAPANGQLLLQEGNLTDIDFFLKLGVNTSAAAGIKRVGTVLQARLNDDSAFATIQGKIRVDNAYVAGATVGTGTITITDSTGTTYRVPVLV